MNKFFKLTVIFCSLLTIQNGSAALDWSMNLAHNNPPGANLGANLLGRSGHFAIEVGLGVPEFKSSGSGDTDTLRLWGDISAKYILSTTGDFLPYLHVGFMESLQGSLSASNNAASYGGAYGGAGLYFWTSSVYVYASANKWANHNNFFYQFGIGFDI